MSGGYAPGQAHSGAGGGSSGARKSGEGGAAEASAGDSAGADIVAGMLGPAGGATARAVNRSWRKAPQVRQGELQTTHESAMIASRLCYGYSRPCTLHSIAARMAAAFCPADQAPLTRTDCRSASCGSDEQLQWNPGPVRRGPAGLRRAAQRPGGRGPQRRSRQPRPGRHDRVVAWIHAQQGERHPAAPAAAAAACCRRLLLADGLIVAALRLLVCAHMPCALPPRSGHSAGAGGGPPAAARKQRGGGSSGTPGVVRLQVHATATAMG